MSAATLRNSHLQGAFFEGAHLEGVDASGANLILSTLFRASLQGAILSKCYYGGTALSYSKTWRIQGTPPPPPQSHVRTLALDFAEQPFDGLTFEAWRQRVLKDIPEGTPKINAVAALARLDPDGGS